MPTHMPTHSSVRTPAQTVRTSTRKQASGAQKLKPLCAPCQTPGFAAQGDSRAAQRGCRRVGADAAAGDLSGTGRRCVHCGRGRTAHPPMREHESDVQQQHRTAHLVALRQQLRWHRAAVAQRDRGAPRAERRQRWPQAAARTGSNRPRALSPP